MTKANTISQRKETLADKLESHLIGVFSLRQFEVGSRIPTEQELCETHNVSRVTVRKALGRLEEAGIINRITGKGSFLLNKPGQSLLPVGSEDIVRNKKSVQISNDILYMTPAVQQDRLLSVFNLAFQSECSSLGYNGLCCSSGMTFQSERNQISCMDLSRYAGACITPHWGFETVDVFFELKQKNFPFVLVDSHFRELACDVVTYDFYQIAFLQTQHLLDIGHRKIGFMLPLPSPTASDRLMGYIEALGGSGLPYQKKFVYEMTSENEETAIRNGYRCAIDLMNRDELPTAIILESDLGAIGAIAALQEMGYDVPGDISVVGFGDYYQPGESAIELTTVSQPIEQAAKTAVNLLKKRIDNAEKEYEFIKLPVELVCAGSSRKL